LIFIKISYEFAGVPNMNCAIYGIKSLYQDLMVFGYNKSLKEKLQNIIDSAEKGDLPAIRITYDTKFKMGDFYLSILSFNETEFEEKPIFAAFYMIHERKLNMDHDWFFWMLTYVNISIIY